MSKAGKNNVKAGKTAELPICFVFFPKAQIHNMPVMASRNHVLLFFAFLLLTTICCCFPDARAEEKRPGNVPEAGGFGGMETQIKRRKRALPAAVIVPLVVGNMLSVIAGSFANDLIVANMWYKTTFCVRVLYRYRLTSSGWKRCWEYAQHSNKKWRRLLKQHHLAAIMRIIVRRLRANSELRFKEARELFKVSLLSIPIHHHSVLLVQAEYDKLLLSGDQVVRVHRMLLDAGIVLPAFQETAQQLSPIDASLDKWRQLDGPEKDLLIAHVEIVRLLRKDYEPFFDAITYPKRLNLRSSIVQMRRLGSKLELEAQQQHLEGVSEFTRKFLMQFVAQLNGESGTRIRNILFLNAQFALYARALTKMAAANAAEGDSAVIYGDRMRQQSAFLECIWETAEQRGSSDLFWEKTSSEAEAAEWAEKNVQEIVERLHLGKEELLDLEAFLANLVPFNAIELSQTRDQQKKKCVRVEALTAEGEFASVVRRENGQLGIELSDIWAQEAAQEMAFVRELVAAIERDFLVDGDDTSNGYEAELEAMRANAAEMAGNGDSSPNPNPVVDSRMLLVHAKLALFGHLLAKDWTAGQPQLDQAALFIGADRLRCEQGLAERLFHFARGLFRLVVDGDKADGNGTEQSTAFEALIDEVRTQIAKMGDAEMAQDGEGTRAILEQLDQTGIWETRLSGELLERMVGEAKGVAERLGAQGKGTTKGKDQRHEERWRSQFRRDQNGRPWTVHRYDKKDAAEEPLASEETAEQQQEEKGRAMSLKRSRSYPTESLSRRQSNIPTPRRRRKRAELASTLAQGFGWSLLTGFLGNWLSEKVDISQTLTNWVLLALRPWRLWRGERPRIIWTVDVRRKKRERGIAQFVERLYLTLFIKLAEVKGKALTQMMYEVEDYIRAALRQEGIETGALDLTNILSELDLFTYRSVRHHVKDRYLKKGQTAAQHWQSQMNIIRTLEEMEYFSERRFERERDKILAEMSATEREEYWAEETVKRPGTFAPTLAGFVRNERAMQIDALKANAHSAAKERLKVVDLGALEEELRGRERNQRMLEQRVREMANSAAAQVSSNGIDLKAVEARIRENEADIQRRQRENGALKKLLEEHQKLDSARNGVDRAKERLQHMALKGGSQQVQVLDDAQLAMLKMLSRLQVLCALVESLIGELRAEMVDDAKVGQKWADERLQHFKLGFEKVAILVDKLALDRVAIGKKKKAYRNGRKSKWTAVRRTFMRMVSYGQRRQSERRKSSVAAVNNGNFDEVLLERIAELAYLMELGVKQMKDKANKSGAKEENGGALLKLVGSQFGAEWAKCEVSKLMREMVAEANGEAQMKVAEVDEENPGEEDEVTDCDQSARDGLAAEQKEEKETKRRTTT